MNEIELKKLKYRDYNNASVDHHDEYGCNNGCCICSDGICICEKECIKDFESVKKIVDERQEEMRKIMEKYESKNYGISEKNSYKSDEKYSSKGDGDELKSDDNENLNAVCFSNRSIEAFEKKNPNRKINKYYKKQLEYNKCKCGNCMDCYAYDTCKCNFKDCDKETYKGDCYDYCCESLNISSVCHFFCNEHKKTHYAELFTISLNKYKYITAANNMRKRYWVIDMFGNHSENDVKFREFRVSKMLDDLNDADENMIIFDTQKNEFVGEHDL